MDHDDRFRPPDDPERTDFTDEPPSPPETPEPPGSATPPEGKDVPLEFHGDGAEYFKIWIVNTALTILTLGIFSAWAKVRTRRYFYGNLRVDGSSFDYLASPIAILKGRIIAAIVIGLLALSSYFNPFLYLALFFFVFAITPWIFVKALRFNARVSAFRNLRFDFQGSTTEAYLYMFVLPLAVPFSLGLLAPYVHAKTTSFMFSGHRYGDQEFDDELPVPDVYILYLKILGLTILLFVAFFVLAFGLGAWNMMDVDPADRDAAPPLIFLLMIYPLSLFFGLAIQSIQQAGMTNLLLNNGWVGKVMRFQSDLRASKLFGIYLGYGILTLLTLGLAFPWMMVKIVRYRAERTRVIVYPALDEVVGESGPGGSATMDQLAEGLDLDVGLDFGF